MCQYVQRAESSTWYINEYHAIYLENVTVELYVI